MIDRTTVKIGWQVDRRNLAGDAGRVDCTTSEAGYYVGVQVDEQRTGRYSVVIRALDTGEQTWVSGIGGQWQGSLNAEEQRQYRTPEADSAWLGQRVVPFEESQVDMLAARLAHDLGCSLLREMSGEYVARPLETADNPVDDMLTLVRNNLADYKALQITTGAGVNSTITTRAHRVDDDLYQYWVTVVPDDAESAMPAVSASAYVYLSEGYLPPTLVSSDAKQGSISDTELLDRFEMVRLNGSPSCSNAGRPVYNRRDVMPDRCYALQTVADDDAVVFFLYHQLNHGLVRLDEAHCSSATRAHIARRSETLMLPLAVDMASSTQWLAADDWQAEPAMDTFYVVATANSRAGRALAKHMEQLPVRCGNSLRVGPEGNELRRWLRDLAAIANHWKGEIDWKSIRVKDIY